MSLWNVEALEGGIVHACFYNSPANYATPEAWKELEQLVTRWNDPSIRAVY